MFSAKREGGSETRPYEVRGWRLSRKTGLRTGVLWFEFHVTSS